MRKLKVLATVVCSAFLLSGCELHFADGTRYDVPWWVAALFAVPFLIFGAILIYINCPKDFWAYCPKCENRFYVKKRVFNMSSHSTDSFEFKTTCPCCGEKTYCRISYDQDK